MPNIAPARFISRLAADWHRAILQSYGYRAVITRKDCRWVVAVIGMDHA
jgi:hypothetical protein